MAKPTGCSVPGCDGSLVVGDCILYERRRNHLGRPMPAARMTERHVYLCQRHFDELDDFLSNFEYGKEEADGQH